MNHTLETTYIMSLFSFDGPPKFDIKHTLTLPICFPATRVGEWASWWREDPFEDGKTEMIPYRESLSTSLGSCLSILGFGSNKFLVGRLLTLIDGVVFLRNWFGWWVFVWSSKFVLMSQQVCYQKGFSKITVFFTNWSNRITSHLTITLPKS